MRMANTTRLSRETTLLPDVVHCVAHLLSFLSLTPTQRDALAHLELLYFTALFLPPLDTTKRQEVE